MPELYRADHVASLLRPEVLKKARSSFDAGDILADGLRELGDRAVQ